MFTYSLFNSFPQVHHGPSVCCSLSPVFCFCVPNHIGLDNAPKMGCNPLNLGEMAVFYLRAKVLYTGVPGIASFGRRRSEALAKAFHRVGNRKVGDEFHALVPQLAGHPQPQRAAELHRQIAVIHSHGQEGLGMGAGKKTGIELSERIERSA